MRVARFFDTMCRILSPSKRGEADAQTDQMKIRVQFYSQLRDLAGLEKIDIDLLDKSKVSDLLEKIYDQFPALRPRDKTLLVGAGVEFVDRNYEIKSGDEISIMPPVQGG